MNKFGRRVNLALSFKEKQYLKHGLMYGQNLEVAALSGGTLGLLWQVLF